MIHKTQHAIRRHPMLRLGVIAAAVAAVAVVATPAHADSPDGQIRAAGTPDVVPDSYIVVLKDSAVTGEQVQAQAQALGSRYSGRIGRTYRDTIRGFEVTLPEAAARRLATDPSVAYVQQNGVVSIADTQTPTPSWGIDRIDQRSQPLNDTFGYPTSAKGVKAYIIDTGIRLTHQDLAGRVISGLDVVDGGSADDANGHGTHVAATVGGTTYGVAKGVTLVAVRVLDENGQGPTSDVIAGIDWATAEHLSGQPAVANLSLGGGTNSALDDAVEKSIADGIVYGVAAGNDGKDACDYSPARVTQAITVGATGIDDARAFFSNTGSCVDIFAPGVDILSAWSTDDSARLVASGTSMAAPHVVGVAAVVLGLYPSLAALGPLTADYVRNYIVLTEATVGVVSDAGPGSPNRLLYLNPLVPLGVSPFADQTTKAGLPFTGQLSASGGYPPYSWTASGLPSGVTVNATTGLISGTPTAIGQFGVVYTVQDGEGQTASKTFTWTVTEAETRTFTGSATASKPTTALTMAASRAQSAATNAGFGHCETIDSTVDLTDDLRSYFATVTLSCIR